MYQDRVLLSACLGKNKAIRPKYGNSKSVYQGIKFDSRREANRYAELMILIRVGEIRDLVLQPEFVLQESFKRNGKTIRAIIYRSDFQYLDVKSEKIIVEDSKGFKTKDYLIKVKLLLYKYPEINFKES